jgi:hypothetical protein
MEQWDATYKLMADHGFTAKPVLEGTGTSAGDAYAWALKNPEKATCILGINPALRSLMAKTSALENLAPLAQASVPLLHVCDQNDPWFADYTQPLKKSYGDLGGEITVIVKGKDHDSTETADAIRFLLGKAGVK